MLIEMQPLICVTIRSISEVGFCIEEVVTKGYLLYYTCILIPVFVFFIAIDISQKLKLIQWITSPVGAK